MPRPPLPIGTWGKISTTSSAGLHVAQARFRDFDGVTRKVERTSTRSKGDAENILRAALRDRAKPSGDDMTSETTLMVAGEKWWRDEIEGQKAYSTERRYKESLVIINQGLGAVRLREVTTARLDGFLRATATHHGPATAKVVKTVLSGILSLSARMDAIPANPIRDVGHIRKPKTEVRALDIEQMRDLRGILHSDQQSILGDLVDPIDMILGTGIRIGECLALEWKNVDLTADPPYVDVVATTLWKKGEGMMLQPHPKSDSSHRRLVLPDFVVSMLQARDRSGLIVFAAVGGGVRDPNNLRKQWRRLIDGTKYDWVTPHTFRKSVASHIAELVDASEQLGHSGTQVTSKHYRRKTHQAPDLRDQLQQIGEPPNTRRKQQTTSVIDDKRRESTSA